MRRQAHEPPREASRWRSEGPPDRTSEILRRHLSADHTVYPLAERRSPQECWKWEGASTFPCRPKSSRTGRRASWNVRRSEEGNLAEAQGVRHRAVREAAPSMRPATRLRRCRRSWGCGLVLRQRGRSARACGRTVDRKFSGGVLATAIRPLLPLLPARRGMLFRHLRRGRGLVALLHLFEEEHRVLAVALGLEGHADLEQGVGDLVRALVFLEHLLELDDGVVPLLLAVVGLAQPVLGVRRELVLRVAVEEVLEEGPRLPRLPRVQLLPG